MNKIFSKILRRNSIMIIMPLAIVVFTISLVAFQLSELREYRSFEMHDASSADTFISAGELNVTFEASGLKKAGYDYLRDDKKAGEYYYLFEDNHVWLFALKDIPGRDLTEGKHVLNVRLTVDEPVMNQIVQDYSTELKTDSRNFTGFVDPVIFNEFEYPELKIKIIKYVYYAGVVVAALTVLYLIAILSSPAASFQARFLTKYGSRRKIIKELDNELEEKLLYKGENTYITENYLVAAYVTHVDVVRLDDIRYLSKHVEELKEVFRKKVIYKLTASNVEKLYYEQCFSSEEVLDKIIYYIRRDDIVDETAELDRENSHHKADGDPGKVTREETKELKKEPRRPRYIIDKSELDDTDEENGSN